MKALKSDLSVHMRSSNLERGLISPVTGLLGEHSCWDISWFCLTMFVSTLFPVVEVTKYCTKVHFEI